MGARRLYVPAKFRLKLRQQKHLSGTAHVFFPGVLIPWAPARIPTDAFLGRMFVIPSARCLFSPSPRQVRPQRDDAEPDAPSGSWRHSLLHLWASAREKKTRWLRLVWRGSGAHTESPAAASLMHSGRVINSVAYMNFLNAHQAEKAKGICGRASSCLQTFPLKWLGDNGIHGLQSGLEFYWGHANSVCLYSS
jgi:hypothetical protein